MSRSSRRADEKPWTSPKQKLTSQRRDTTGLRKRFSAATVAIDRAMTASTSRSGSATRSSAASVRVTLWASVKAVTILASESQPSPSQEHQQEEQMSQPGSNNVAATRRPFSVFI